MSPEALAQLLPLVLIFALFWFLILRPARKKQQAATQLRSSLAVGDTVLLGSGIYGRVEEVDEDSRDLRLEIAPGVVVRAHRDAVVSKEHSDAPPAGGPGGDVNPAT
ncbi:MAG: preprotein translocase subunit YajC [Actinomycetota bacterium]|nr:preprotein translocase subunit YajC [Actinomycetota bacterium]